MLRSVSMLPLMSAATCGLESQKTMPIAGSGRQKHGRGKMKFRRRANSNDNAIRAESLLKTDDRVLELVFWSALADDLHTFLGADRLDLAVSVP
jgi:hypothetical protein